MSWLSGKYDVTLEDSHGKKRTIQVVADSAQEARTRVVVRMSNWDEEVVEVKEIQ